MFREELGSRLRGEGFTVHPYDSLDDLIERINRENYEIQLVIIDLQEKSSGSFSAIETSKSKNLRVLVLGEHKNTDALDKARKLGADKVIINSQASKSIEKYVHELLKV